MSLSELELSVWEASRARAKEVSDDERRLRGVVHTPPALARAVVASADRCLRERLGLPGGLADPSVTIVDPACGTGAFVAAAAGLCGDRLTSPDGIWACDLDRAALEVAERTLGAPLRSAGWRAAFQHADTLALRPDLAGLQDAATGTLAPRFRVVAVIGNPPWSTAAPAGKALAAQADPPASLMDDFRRLPDGAPLGERKLGVLSDRYVRFMRWAFALATGAPRAGVVALVTNGSFVDGPVHRAMRAAITGWSSELQIIDLGGNAMLGRLRQRDDNLFGVRPSVAVTLALCRPAARGRNVRYARMRGSNGDKLAALASWAQGDERALATVPVVPPMFAFVPAGRSSGVYPSFVSLSEAMPFHREGVQTNRDRAVIASSPGALLTRLRAFVAGGTEDPALAAACAASRHYDPARARAAVAEALVSDPDGCKGVSVRPLAYRQRDLRFFCPVVPFCHRPRPALLRAMAHAQLGLVSVRKDRGDLPWRHIGAVSQVADSSFLSTRSSCRTRLFPTHGPNGGANLLQSVADRFLAGTGQPLTVGAFVRYTLAVLSAPAYQACHDRLLRQSYPRVPVPADPDRFSALVAVGERLLTVLLGPGPTAPRDAPSDVPSGDLDALLDQAWVE